METALFYFPLIILLSLAISDLIVGVSNDAVNFTNSAVGSHVAPRWVIFLVASAGILIGTIYSSGMLEIARKGIIYPEYFTFDNVITIFLAVMFTDVILLDLFNTYGLPTSTTVSFVFELLGSAFAVSVVILLGNGSDFSQISQYINSDRALLLILGIFLSVIIALIGGIIIQFLTRLLFTFRIKKHHRTISSLWSALAISFIFYYILIKGLKNAALLSENHSTWLYEHVTLLFFILFLVSSVVFLILNFVFKINPLKFVVMAGTFALALAFAANDLVNFIGVPLAGLVSYQIIQFDPNSSSVLMNKLSQSIDTPFVFLMFASTIMVLALWFSKKGKYVTKTEVDLARQSATKERFSTSKIAKFIVSINVSIYNIVKNIIPIVSQKWIAKRFKHKKRFEHSEQELLPAFDLVRASVNLTIASSLISFGTSLKLPLSTTYVTFMVAMGTSIADGAWTTDNAVNRVNGVLVVIGGWLSTGLIAFTIAFLFALLIHFGGILIILLLIIFILFSMIKSRNTFLHRLENK